MPTGPRTITIIRHGEKPSETDPTQPPFGVEASGKQNPHSLIPQGWQRANALADLLSGDAVRAPFARPTALFAPLYPDHEDMHRPYQTLMPTAAKLGLPIQTPFPEGQEADLAQTILQQAGADVLVCWEHHHLPMIVAGLAPALGLATVPPNGQLWPDNDFWSALVFGPDATGAAYQVFQTSEALLQGDAPAS